MADSFTTLWTADRCKLVKRYHLEGTPLSLLFGGPHTSEPGFRRAGVKAGDSPEMRILAPTCTDEVVLGDESTPLRLDTAIPPELLERLRFRSQKRERGLRHIQDGRLKSAVSLQGIYRLSEGSAGEIAALLMGHGEIDAG